MNTELPNKMSDLLELAVKDSLAVSKKKGYILRMDTWHQPNGDICYVCMAGAVMARSLKVRKHETLGVYDVPPKHSSKLDAINYMRIGRFHTAHDFLSVGDPTKEQLKVMDAASRLLLDDLRNEYENVSGSCVPTKSKIRGRATWSTYRKCVKMLRKVGL